jgi:hypothetical protein
MSRNFVIKCCVLIPLLMCAELGLSKSKSGRKKKKSSPQASRTTSEPKKKPMAQQPVEMEPVSSSASNGVESKKIVRGLLGLYIQDGSNLIFGVDGTYPSTSTIAWEGGLDYLKFGNEIFSVSLMHFAGGAMYVMPINPTTVVRFGGRAGIARVTVSTTLFSDEEGSTSASSSTFFGEARAAVETEFNGMMAGAVVKLPIFYGSNTAGTRSISLLGTFGLAL